MDSTELVGEFLVPWSVDTTEVDGNRTYAVSGFVHELIVNGYESEKVLNACTIAAYIVYDLCERHDISINGLKNA